MESCMHILNVLDKQPLKWNSNVSAENYDGFLWWNDGIIVRVKLT